MILNQNKYSEHSFFMRLALAEAQKNLGNTKNNPSVGCVITKIIQLLALETPVRTADLTLN